MAKFIIVATALTVYGIETDFFMHLHKEDSPVATALTVYGIETYNGLVLLVLQRMVATALTVYGIETLSQSMLFSINSGLQQHLPFTVLKQCKSHELSMANY